jgi:hypothetical protein
MATTTHLVNGVAPVLSKVVYELRYPNGYTYLDRCGRLINSIIQADPAWSADAAAPSPQSASLISFRNSCVLNINTKKLDLVIEMPLTGDPLDGESIQAFAEQVDAVSIQTSELLGLEAFDRMGCRLWYLFPFDSSADCEAWLQSLNCFQISEAVIYAFGGTREAANFALVVSGEDCSYRLAVQGVERITEVDLGKDTMRLRPRDISKGQKELLLKQEKEKARIRRAGDYPALIDIDAYVDNPADPSGGDFVRKTFSESLERFRSAIK